MIALIDGHSKERSRAKRMKDRLSPFPHIPTVLYREDQLREITDVLSAGNVLFIAADRETGKQISVPIGNDWTFSMATGSFRLASRYDAELIPCLMTDEGRWRFHLEICRPVPREYFASGSDMRSCGQYLVELMLPHIRKHPEQCSHFLLNCFGQMPSSARAEGCSA